VKNGGRLSLQYQPHIPMGTPRWIDLELIEVQTDSNSAKTTSSVLRTITIKG